MAETQQEVISNLGLELNIDKNRIKDFEKNILQIGNKEKISTNKKTFVDWAFLVHDFNRMHVFSGYIPELLKKAGIKKPPMHGTRIIAFEEQYILGIKKILEEFTEKDLYYNKHRAKFESPLCPGIMGGVSADWNLESAVVEDEGIKLKVLATDGKGEKYLTSSIFLGYKVAEKSDQDVIKFLSSNNLVHKTRMEVKQGEGINYYELLNKKIKEEDLIISPIHIAAFGPATLLELSSKRTGRPEGAYRQVDFEFYNKPKLGIFETSLKMLSCRESEDGFAYRFEALCLQDGKPILAGKLNCVSPNEFKTAA